MGLQEYLVYCKGALEKLLDFPAVHVVLSNEACDLDSAVSAIAYAYYLHETSTAPVGTAIFLPLLNIRRSDFPLRTEITYFLGKYNISADHLIFLDDLDLNEVKVSTALKLTLVDHHVLSASQTDLEENVIQIIDHRPQDGILPDRVDSTLELVGSCCTLVTEALLADEGFSMDEVTAALLHGTIITDTINFSPAAGKTTPKDLDMAEKLGVFLPLGVDSDSVFQEIKNAKFDLSGLTTVEILQKDLKVVQGDSLMVATSSVTMDMSEFSARPDFLQSLQQFAGEKNVDAVVILTVSIKDKNNMSRQLGIFSPSRVYREQMADVLNTSQSPNLGLSTLQSNHEEFLAFEQANVKASRKQILPIIKGFLAGETTPDENQSNAYVDLPKERSEGFTSMSSIVGSQASISDGEITSEDLISRDNSLEKDICLEDVLPSAERKVFDPLSSVHSSDSVSSPSEAVGDDKTAFGDSASNKRVIVGEVLDGDFLREGVKNVPKENEDSFETGVAFIGGADVEEDDEEVAARGVGATRTEGSEDRGSIEAEFDPFAGNVTGNNSSSAEQANRFDSDPSGSESNLFGSSAFNTPVSPHNNPDSDPSQHNGLNDDLLDLDPLSLTAPHEVLFPPDSPADFSAATSGQTSGQTSGHGSKAPSYPVTPPNSYMDSELGLTKEIHLPSFNSSEMVEKINEKKAALEGGAGDGAHVDVLSPFTPQNSYVESSLEANYAKQTQLPSFHSSDMVERIREKRSSMEREIGSGNDFDGGFLDVSKSPFTPHNSFVDGSFDKYARENLPSLNNAEIASRIKQKQAELAAAAGDVGIDITAPDDIPHYGYGGSDSPTMHAYTPQNSYRESPLTALADSRVPDLNEVAERLSLSESESSGSLNEPKPIKASNKVHMQGSSPQDGPASEFGEGFGSSMKNDSQESDLSQNPHQNLSDFGEGLRSGSANFGDNFGSTQASASQQATGDVSASLAQELQESTQTTPSQDISEEITMKTIHLQEEGSEETNIKQKKSRGVKFAEVEREEKEEEEDSAVMESAIQKIAYDLANEMIQKALETFPSESVKQLVPGAEDLSPTVDAEASPALSPTLERYRASSREKELGSEFVPASQASPTETEQTESPRTRKMAFAMPSPFEVPSQVAEHREESAHEGDNIQEGGNTQEAEENTESSSADESPTRESPSATADDSLGGGTEEYPIETEYLCDMDQRVNRFSRESNVIETDADKEVVESSSFRKISGQENQTVQEEILEQIRQEAWERTQSKMRQSSVAEEDESDNDGDDNGGDDIDDDDDDDEMPEEEKQAPLGERTLQQELEAVNSGAADFGDSIEGMGASEEAESAKLEEDQVSFDPLGALTSSPVKGTKLKFPEDPTLSSPEAVESSDAKRKVVPEADISLDDSLTGEDGKKMIHVVRDRELYASALNNVSASEDDVPEKRPTQKDDSLLDSSDLEEKSLRKKVEVGTLDESSLLEEEHKYESFTETGSVSAATVEGEEREAMDEKGDQGTVSAKKAAERMLSAASDVSQKGDRLKGVELMDEWQDDELPNVIGAEGQELTERPATLGAASDESRKRLVPDSDLVPEADDDLKDVPVVDSDSEFDSDMDNDQLEWENDTPVQTPEMRVRERETIPEYTAEEERRESRMWKVVRFDSQEFTLDMKVIEPYKRVLSHGGYYGDSLNAMVVFSGCYLPSRDRKDYSYVMDHLFNYVIHTLDELVADDYMIVYFHGATPRRQMPSFGWLKRCYQCIDRKLKKNLKALYLVHPTLWLKTVVLMTKPFISSKFSSKLQFVRTLDDLKKLIPMEYVYIPEQVQSLDEHLKANPTAIAELDAKEEKERLERKAARREKREQTK